MTAAASTAVSVPSTDRITRIVSGDGLSPESDGRQSPSLDDLQVPDEFVCPLTLELMNDPLMDRTGMNFEREAIMEWLNRGHDSCPLTRRPLSYSKLVPNAQLRLKIDQWKRDHGLPVHRNTAPKKIQNMGGTFDAPSADYHPTHASPYDRSRRSRMIHLMTTEALVRMDESRQNRDPAAVAHVNGNRQQPRQGGSHRRLPFSRMVPRRRGSAAGHEGPETPGSRRRRMVNILDNALSVVRHNQD